MEDASASPAGWYRSIWEPNSDLFRTSNLTCAQRAPRAMLSLAERLRQGQPQGFSEGRTIFIPSGTSGLLVPLGFPQPEIPGDSAWDSSIQLLLDPQLVLRNSLAHWPPQVLYPVVIERKGGGPGV